jgi:hypothetical protein
MKKEHFPNLEFLFSAYFHEDWQLDKSSPAENVRWFVEREPPEKVTGARRELDAILKTSMTDQELRSLVVESLGSYYDPMLTGKSMRTWLQEIDEGLCD